MLLIPDIALQLLIERDVLISTLRSRKITFPH